MLLRFVVALAIGLSPKPTALAQWLPAAERVSIPSTVDGSTQQAYFYDPAPFIDVPVPLLVALHSWSSDYAQGDNAAFVKLARERGWVVIHPNFRGPNVRPEAAGSDLVIADIRDAVAYVRRRREVDSTRIYLVGASGGGFTALLAAARAPELWAGVSAWVPIADLERWHAYSRGRGTRYWRDIENVVGGDPNLDPGARAEARRRSPRFRLAAAADYPFAIDINVGIDDNLVRPSQSLLAFNALAAARDTFSQAEMDFVDDRRALPPNLRNEGEPDDFVTVLLRRVSRGHRITVFDGGHVINYPGSVAWLGGQRRRAASGIAERREVQSLQLYPSPAAPGDVVSVTLPSPSVAARLLVFDAAGRQVDSFEVAAGAAARFRFRAPETAGAYAIRLSAGDVTYTQTLTVR